MTNYYGSSVYGLVTLSFTVFIILAVVGKAGMDLNYTRYIAAGVHTKTALSALFTKSTFFSFLMSCVLALLIIGNKDWLALKLFDKPQFSEYLFWAAVSFPLWSLILIHAALYRGLKKNTLFAIFNAFGRFLTTLIFLLIGIYLLKINAETLPVMAHWAALLLLLLICMFLTHIRMDYRLCWNNLISFGRFLNESRPMLISSLVFILLSWIDRLFLGVYQTEEDIAIYDIAAKLALLISFNLDAVNSILAPKVVENYTSDDKKALQESLRFSVGISASIALLTFLLLYVFKDFLLGLFGHEFIAGSTPLIILGLGQLANCLCGSVGIILQMTGHQKIYQRILMMGLIVNLILNFALVVPYGTTGVAIATSVSLIFWNLLGVYYVRKKIGVIPYFKPWDYISKSDRNG